MFPRGFILLLIVDIALVFVGLAFLCNASLYRECYDYTYQHGCECWYKGIAVKDWIDLTLTAIMVIATWGMWVVVDQQRELLADANRTAGGSLTISKQAHQVAVDGVEQAKRSVEAYIDGERGRMSFEDFPFLQKWINCSFQNRGEKTVTIKGFTSLLEVRRALHEFAPLEIKNFEPVNLPIDVYDRYVKTCHFKEGQVEAFEAGGVIRLSGAILYETAFGDYVNQHTVFFSKDDAGKLVVHSRYPDPGEIFCFDRRWNRTQRQ